VYLDLLHGEPERAMTSLYAKHKATASIITALAKGGFVERFEREDRRREVAEALGRLGPDERLLVVMKDVEGTSIQDIAASLGLRAGTVKSRLHRSREKLARILGQGALS
jgi:RNA polymerase sigma factor (sigma-70 family)